MLPNLRLMFFTYGCRQRRCGCWVCAQQVSSYSSYIAMYIHSALLPDLANYSAFLKDI